MLNFITHTLFGCPPEGLIATVERIHCTGCGCNWWKDKLGKWVTHEERDWSLLCLRK